jgi:hypothetical protein
MRRLIAFAAFFSALFVTTTFHCFAAENPPVSTSHPLTAASWGFECMYGHVCGTTGQWIKTTSQPGTVRLWDAGVAWSVLETSSGAYDWSNLDTWLDLIAQHRPTAAIYTFGHVPCFITTGKCSGQGWDDWSPGPPKDLTSSGSRTLNSFVTQLVYHCSPAGHCVKDYIKYWEMWNEANLPNYWTGNVTQLYQLLKPAISIIRNAVPGAVVSTPPVCGGDTAWMASWMQQENTHGRLSDYYGFHVYLRDGTPEDRIKMVGRMVTTKNSNGWTTAPWMNTETNFVNTDYTCSGQYTAADCEGQLVRWHVLQYAYQGGTGGAVHIGWFNWPSITSGIDYDTYYYTMMQWLKGATFKQSCTQAGDLWTCSLKEANGASGLIVWNASGNVGYTPATQYKNYREFNGTYGGKTVSIAPGQRTTVGVIPIMFQTK